MRQSGCGRSGGCDFFGNSGSERRIEGVGRGEETLLNDLTRFYTIKMRGGAGCGANMGSDLGRRSVR